jgi:hypothetical protein
MILLITYGLFHSNLNLTPSLHCPTSLLMWLLSSAAPLRPSSATTGMSLTALPPQTFLLSKGTQLWMSCPYTSSQNGKAGHIIHPINNVIRILLIQASLLERTSPSLALLRRTTICVSSATCVTLTLPSPRPTNSPLSPPGVFLGYSSDHKDYRCLDLYTNRLIVSRHVVFDEDNFPLTASPNLTDLDFLLESGSTVSTIGT